MSGLILLGGGGHAQSVIDVCKAQGRYVIGGLLANESGSVSGYEILGTDEKIPELLRLHYTIFYIAIGSVGSSEKRMEVYKRVKQYEEIEWGTVLSPFAYIAPSAKICPGVFVGHGAMIGPNAVIHSHAIINSGAVIEHGAEVGAFTHCAPHSTILGETKIGSGSFIGAGSVVTGKFGQSTIVWAGKAMRGND